MSDGLSRGLLAAGYTRRNIYIPVFPNIYLNYIFLVSAFVLFIPFVLDNLTDLKSKM